MSDTPFHQTRMGRTFFEHTLPRLVEQLERLNSNLERVAACLQPMPGDAGTSRGPSVDGGSDEHAVAPATSDRSERPAPDRPSVVLVGADGNAFSILARCVRAARAAGWSAERIAAFRDEATGGDYNHLLRVVQDAFDAS